MGCEADIISGKTKSKKSMALWSCMISALDKTTENRAKSEIVQNTPNDRKLTSTYLA